MFVIAFSVRITLDGRYQIARASWNTEEAELDTYGVFVWRFINRWKTTGLMSIGGSSQVSAPKRYLT